MATGFWLVRHAIVAENERARLYGVLDVQLCPDSLVRQLPQYSALARTLPQPARWLCTPLSRTRRTAEAIMAAGYPAQELAVEPGLIEQDLGDYQGLAHAALPPLLTAPAHPFWPLSADERPPGGESMADVVRRVGAAMERLAAEHDGQGETDAMERLLVLDGVVIEDLQVDEDTDDEPEPVDLAALLAESDVVSLHVPETPATHGMIGQAEIRAMKKGAFLINNSRGTVVDLEALAAALRDNHLRGAAVDVFPVEPTSAGEAFRSPLQGLENVILTPHIGGSTEEAQERIGTEVARKLVEYSDTGSTVGAVNFPQVLLTPRPDGTRYMLLVAATGTYLIDRAFNVRRVQLRWPAAPSGDPASRKLGYNPEGR